MNQILLEDLQNGVYEISPDLVGLHEFAHLVQKGFQLLTLSVNWLT